MLKLTVELKHTPNLLAISYFPRRPETAFPATFTQVSVCMSSGVPHNHARQNVLATPVAFVVPQCQAEAQHMPIKLYLTWDHESGLTHKLLICVRTVHV